MAEVWWEQLEHERAMSWCVDCGVGFRYDSERLRKFCDLCTFQADGTVEFLMAIYDRTKG